MFISIGMALAKLAGRQVSEKVAKVIGLAVMAIALVTIFFIAKALYDKSVVDDYRDKREAEIAKAALKADRKANAADVIRDNEFADSQADIAEGITNATANDPRKGATPVGPVSQSYYDRLRAQQRDAAPRR